MVMIFQSEKARNFLLKNGYVFTFRLTKRKKEGNDWMNEKRGGKKITDIHVTWYVIVTPNYTLKEYVADSGFDSLEEWQQEISRLNNGSLPNYGTMYHVELGHK